MRHSRLDANRSASCSSGKETPPQSPTRSCAKPNAMVRDARPSTSAADDSNLPESPHPTFAEFTFHVLGLIELPKMLQT